MAVHVSLYGMGLRRYSTLEAMILGGLHLRYSIWWNVVPYSVCMPLYEIWGYHWAPSNSVGVILYLHTICAEP